MYPQRIRTPWYQVRRDWASRIPLKRFSASSLSQVSVIISKSNWRVFISEGTFAYCFDELIYLVLKWLLRVFVEFDLLLYTLMLFLALLHLLLYVLTNDLVGVASRR